MNNPLLFHAFLTVVAILCLVMTWHEYTKERLSRRATVFVLGFGSLSWATQMWLFGHIDLTNGQLTTYLFWCIVLAFGGFVFVILCNQTRRILGRDVAQALLWGQFVFPVVLVSFLPDGIITLVSLLR